MMFNENAIKNKVQTYKNDIRCFFSRLTTPQAVIDAEERKIDKALKESFPASDPLGFTSKSLEDKELH